MTHDELLFKIYEIYNNSSDAGQEANKQYRGMIHFMHALRAVVKLHEPDGQSKPFPDWANCCGEAYPCPTIQAIEKELNG